MFLLCILPVTQPLRQGRLIMYLIFTKKPRKPLLFEHVHRRAQTIETVDCYR